MRATESAVMQATQETDEKDVLQKKIAEWLSDENIEWAEGRGLLESTSKFGNVPEPIAILPQIVIDNVPSLQDRYLYCGKAYLIDHQANHHPELCVEEYNYIQAILDSYDDIKDLSSGNGLKLAFVKHITKGYAVVVELSKDNGKFILHKTFFYKGGRNGRTPYRKKSSILEKWSVDGSTTISPVEKQPADTANISALDQMFGSKGMENSE